ncbi:hypothetical protein KIPB_007418 [Kipferlia bialata]|uniref:Uncharacterized protein n=1 Tax=Kipferlia bialata TaxID=797122 RepID=A0A391NX37_9EUKA|nr:hypothetical protein KIPB_007418 [Kipferlia bialata]|eukprot:g7418.t1
MGLILFINHSNPPLPPSSSSPQPVQPSTLLPEYTQLMRGPNPLTARSRHLNELTGEVQAERALIADREREREAAVPAEGVPSADGPVEAPHPVQVASHPHAPIPQFDTTIAPVNAMYQVCQALERRRVSHRPRQDRERERERERLKRREAEARERASSMSPGRHPSSAHAPFPRMPGSPVAKPMPSEGQDVARPSARRMSALERQARDLSQQQGRADRRGPVPRMSIAITEGGCILSESEGDDSLEEGGVLATVTPVAPAKPLHHDPRMTPETSALQDSTIRARMVQAGTLHHYTGGAEDARDHRRSLLAHGRYDRDIGNPRPFRLDRTEGKDWDSVTVRNVEPGVMSPLQTQGEVPKAAQGSVSVKAGQIARGTRYERPKPPGARPSLALGTSPVATPSQTPKEVAKQSPSASSPGSGSNGSASAPASSPGWGLGGGTPLGVKPPASPLSTISSMSPLAHKISVVSGKVEGEGLVGIGASMGRPSPPHITIPHVEDIPLSSLESLSSSTSDSESESECLPPTPPSGLLAGIGIYEAGHTPSAVDISDEGSFSQALNIAGASQVSQSSFVSPSPPPVKPSVMAASRRAARRVPPRLSSQCQPSNTSGLDPMAASLTCSDILSPDEASPSPPPVSAWQYRTDETSSESEALFLRVQSPEEESTSDLSVSMARAYSGSSSSEYQSEGSRGFVSDSSPSIDQRETLPSTPRRYLDRVLLQRMQELGQGGYDPDDGSDLWSPSSSSESTNAVPTPVMRPKKRERQRPKASKAVKRRVPTKAKPVRMAPIRLMDEVVDISDSESESEESGSHSFTSLLDASSESTEPEVRALAARDEARYEREARMRRIREGAEQRTMQSLYPPAPSKGHKRVHSKVVSKPVSARDVSALVPGSRAREKGRSDSKERLSKWRQEANRRQKREEDRRRERERPSKPHSSRATERPAPSRAVSSDKGSKVKRRAAKREREEKEREGAAAVVSVAKRRDKAQKRARREVDESTPRGKGSASRERVPPPAKRVKGRASHGHQAKAPASSRDRRDTHKAPKRPSSKETEKTRKAPRTQKVESRSEGTRRDRERERDRDRKRSGKGASQRPRSDGGDRDPKGRSSGDKGDKGARSRGHKGHRS